MNPKQQFQSLAFCLMEAAGLDIDQKGMQGLEWWSLYGCKRVCRYNFAYDSPDSLVFLVLLCSFGADAQYGLKTCPSPITTEQCSVLTLSQALDVIQKCHCSSQETYDLWSIRSRREGEIYMLVYNTCLIYIQNWDWKQGTGPKQTSWSETSAESVSKLFLKQVFLYFMFVISAQ